MGVQVGRPTADLDSLAFALEYFAVDTHVPHLVEVGRLPKSKSWCTRFSRAMSCGGTTTKRARCAQSMLQNPSPGLPELRHEAVQRASRPPNGPTTVHRTTMGPRQPRTCNPSTRGLMRAPRAISDARAHRVDFAPMPSRCCNHHGVPENGPTGHSLGSRRPKPSANHTIKQKRRFTCGPWAFARPQGLREHPPLGATPESRGSCATSRPI